MKRSRIITLIILAVLLLTATIIVLRADGMAEDLAVEYIRQAADEQQITAQIKGCTPVQPSFFILCSDAKL